MYGQGNYAPQFRHGPPAPPLPFQAPPPATPQPPFQQAPLTGAPPPPPQQGPPHQAANQIPQVPPPPLAYHHGLGPSQPVHHPPPGMVNMVQPYIHLNPPSSSNYGNPPAAHPYAPQVQTGAPYPPPMGNQNVHHISPPAVPPPGGLPPTGVSSQGQPLYRTPPPPPPPGIQHVPTPPPPPPSSFVSITPAPFMPFVHASVGEAHPPSLPPPPPPPPPSSPPPLPSPPPPPGSQGEGFPIADSEEMADDRAMKDHDPDQNVNGPGDAAQLLGGVHIGDWCGNEKVQSLANKEEPPAHLSPPPPRPADEVVRNIEALCKFMVNVGPQFENLARANEAGNPRFSFLFGGEPGSAAAVGYEYFQWMKRKHRLDDGPCNHPEQIVSSQTPSKPESPIDENEASLAESDMDMDDDAGLPERSQGIAELNEETIEEPVSQRVVEKQFHAPPNVAQERVLEMSVLRCSPSSEASFHSLEKHDGDKFTEHHLSAASPEATTGTLSDNEQQSMESAFADAIPIDITSSRSDGTNVEVPRVFVKDGSPFRLIQGYASDDSGEDDRKESVVRVSSGMALQSGRVDASYENEPTELHSALDLKNVSVTEKSGQLYIESAEVHLQHMPTAVHAVESLPASHDELPATSLADLLQRVGSSDDFGSHEKDGQTLDGGKGALGASCHSDIAEAEKDGFSQQAGEFCWGKKYSTKDSIMKVDEFGRMIKEGASSSDSEEMTNERRGRRGRSRSRSQSPQQSRRRSRSPWRRRGRRSPSQSWSPKRQSRSKSPPLLRHVGERARRNHLPPECIHFLRGRCYRGASCWFLHSDSGRHRNRPQDHRDVSQDSEKDVHNDVGHVAENIVKGTAAVQRESFPLEEDTQELQAGTDIILDTTKDEVLATGGNLDSIKDDAKHFVSDEQVLSKNTGEGDHGTGSPEVLNQFQELHHAEPKQEASDTCLAESQNAQKPQSDSHPLADTSLGDQISSISETPHLIGEGNLGQPSPPEVPIDQPQQSFSVSTPMSEPQNVSSSQYLHVDLIGEGNLGQPSSPEVPIDQPQQSFSVSTPMSEPQNVSSSQYLHVDPSISQLSSAQPMQSSNLHSLMPAAQPFTIETSVTESHVRPSLVDQSFLNQVPGVRHFAPQPSGFAGGDFNIHFSQTQPPPFQGHPPHVSSFAQTQLQPSQGHPPHYPSYASQPPRENWVQTSRTNLLSQPPPTDMFPPSQPSFSGNYTSLNIPPPPKPTWADLPPPSYGKGTIMHPIPSTSSHPHLQNDGPFRGEFPSTDTRLHHHPVEQKYMNDFMQRPLPGGTQQGQTFGGPTLIREEQHYLRHPVTDGHQLVSSFQPPPINKERSVPYSGYNMQPQDHRSFLRDDFHASAGGMPYSQLASHGLQCPTSSSFPSNMGETGGVGSSLRHPLSISERLSDGGLPKRVVPTHYNPFASTFEQSSTNSKYVSDILGQDGSTSFGSKYASPFGYDHRLMGGHGSAKLATSPLSAGGTDVTFLTKPGGAMPSAASQELTDRSYPWQQSVEDIVQKQLRREPPVGDQYDPLFDSIEPSSKMSTKLSSVQEQDPVVHDRDITGTVHLPADVEENNKQKVGPVVAAKIENDEFGETAPDAEVGAVENESPILVDGRDWSPAIPIDLPDKVMGEIEIDQVRSPGKSKKTKDSRSMKLFKIALADFVKEVLKPSWRQGNMSKEAFKTIVKKTVDKVSGSVSRHQIPKTQAKINQYVESSQRKLTKLVMGYVDKYVKM